MLTTPSNSRESTFKNGSRSNGTKEIKNLINELNISYFLEMNKYRLNNNVGSLIQAESTY